MDWIVTIPREEAADFMIAVTELEQIDAHLIDELPNIQEAISIVSRIASLIQGQIDAQ